MCRAVTTALLLCSSTEEEALFMKHKSSSSALSPPTSHSRLSTRPHSSNSAISLWQNFCSVCLKKSSIAQKTSQTIYEFDTIFICHFPPLSRTKKSTKRKAVFASSSFAISCDDTEGIFHFGGDYESSLFFHNGGLKTKKRKKKEEEPSRERKIPSGKVRCAISFLSHLSSPPPLKAKVVWMFVSGRCLAKTFFSFSHRARQQQA